MSKEQREVITVAISLFMLPLIRPEGPLFVQDSPKTLIKIVKQNTVVVVQYN